MKDASRPANKDSDDVDPVVPLQHTGEQPFRRPPEDEPERVGEGELDIGAPSSDVTVRDRVWEGEEDDEVVGPEEED